MHQVQEIWHTHAELILEETESETERMKEFKRDVMDRNTQRSLRNSQRKIKFQGNWGRGIQYMMADNFQKYVKEKYLILGNSELQTT